MKIMIKFYRLTILCAAMCLSYMSATAEEPDSLKNRKPSMAVEVEEIEIRSFKQDRSYKMMPISATSLGISAMRNSSVVGIKDITALVPNLFMPDYGSKLTSPIYIRGIGSRINSPSVGLYVDGIPYFEKSSFDFDFNSIESIDVLRGPQGTLYGRNTMGGVVNVYTKSPFKNDGTSLYFTGGSHTNLDAGIEHYGSVKDKFGYSISANYAHTDGYFLNEYTGENADKSDSGSARVKLTYKANKNLTFDLMAAVDLSKQGGYPYALYNNETGEVASVNYNDYSFYNRNMATSGFGVRYEQPKYILSSQTSFQYVKDNQGIDQDFSVNNIYFVQQRQTQNMVSEEFNIKSNTNRNYKWLFGAFFFYQKIDNAVTMDYKKQNMFTDKTYGMPNAGAAAYHQSTFDNLLTKGLSLTVGIRYDYEFAATNYNYDRLLKGEWSTVDNFRSDLNFSQVSPKAALQYTILENNIVYGTVTRGFKAGGFNTSFEKDEDRAFSPEFSWNYEVGAKSSFLDGALTGELTFFYIDWRNQQIYQPLPSGNGSMLKNAGRSSSKGVEVSLYARPAKNLNLRANYGYTYAKFESYQRSETENFSGNFLPYVPRNTVGAFADYTLYINKYLKNITFAASYTGVGNIFWNDSNTINEKYYGLVNAKISFGTRKLTLDLWGKNITNKEYFAFQFETSGKNYVQLGRPITFGATLRYNL